MTREWNVPAGARQSINCRGPFPCSALARHVSVNDRRTPVVANRGRVILRRRVADRNTKQGVWR